MRHDFAQNAFNYNTTLFTYSLLLFGWRYSSTDIATANSMNVPVRIQHRFIQVETPALTSGRIPLCNSTRQIRALPLAISDNGRQKSNPKLKRASLRFIGLSVDWLRECRCAFFFSLVNKYHRFFFREFTKSIIYFDLGVSDPRRFFVGRKFRDICESC